MNRFRAALVAACLVVLAAPASAASLDLNPLIQTTVLPLLETILAGVATGVLGFGYTWLRTKWGIDIEAKHREALHSAIITGINLAVAKGQAITGPAPKIPVSNPLISIALSYAMKSVPDAINHFGLTEDRVAQMILAKLPQVLGQTAPSVSPPVAS